MGAGRYARMMRRRGVDPCAYVPGLYTESEVDDLINIDGYIPVASAVEFDKIRTGASETMGGCTIWAGTYTTGRDKKYVQVGVIDLSIFNTGTGWDVITSLDLVYDGNEIPINNLYINNPSASVSSLFSMPASTTGAKQIQLKNIRLSNVNVTAGTITSALCALYYENTSLSGSSSIDNCIVNVATVNGTTDTGGVIGLIGGTTTDFPATNMTNIEFTGDVNGTGSGVGGFAARFRQAGTVESCKINAEVNGATSSTGGFIGSMNNGANALKCSYDGDVIVSSSGTAAGCFVGQLFTNTSSVKECSANGSITAASMDWVGGFAGAIYSNALAEDCKFNGSVVGNAQVGGFVGRRGGAGSRTVNCICIATASGASGVGGFGGFNGGGTNATTACYFDSDVFGSSTTYTGSAQTTTDLQTPTSNTGIYSAWTIPPWDFGTSTDYPVLTTTP